MSWGTDDVRPRAADVPDRAIPHPAATPLHPPVRLLALAAVVGIVSWVLLPSAEPSAHIIGWALGSLVVVTILTVYTAVDTARMQSTLYVHAPAARHVRACIALVSVAAAALHAFAVATAVAS